MDSTAPDWVSETAFGKWFLSTDVWLRYVLTQAVTDLHALAGASLPRAPQRLLDIGCGQGAAFGLLQQHFSPTEILGVDVDRSVLARAQAKAAAANVRTLLRHGSVTALELDDASVDIVFCHQLIHHVSQQETALRELLRVLTPGGLLLLSESCKPFIDSWPVRWFFRHPDGVQKSADAYIELVRACGFAVADKQVRAYAPWWSLPDLGVRARLGIGDGNPSPTEVLIVGRKPVEQAAPPELD